VPEIKYPDPDSSEILLPSYIKDTFLDLCLSLRVILVEEIGIK